MPRSTPLRKPVLAIKGDDVAFVTMNRPPANLIDRDMLVAIGKAVAGATDDDDVSVIVLIGGEKVFSEGLDLDAFKKSNDDERLGLVRIGREVVRSLSEAPKPTIAAISGKALGAGLELALACDVRLASEDAQFGCPEVSQALVPLFGGIGRLEKLIGIPRSRSLVFIGEPIPAWEALEIGLIGKVVPSGALLEEARIASARFAGQPKAALRAAKRMMLKTDEKERDESVENFLKSDY